MLHCTLESLASRPNSAFWQSQRRRSGGNVDVAKLLVQYKAPLNTKSQAAETPLHYAATKGHLEMVKYLVEIGTNPHMKKYPDGETAADLAEHAKCLTVAAWLREYMANNPPKTE